MIKTTEMLAVAYCAQLHTVLTPDQISEVNRRNAAEPMEYICHTHDFCDANQCMIDALASLQEELDPQDSAQVAWIDEAWSLAKEAGFDALTVRGATAGLGGVV